MSESPRVLVVTASFGDGHNSAARNVAEALREQGATVRVRDYFEESHPEANRSLVVFYRWAITYFPRGWSQLYKLAAKAKFNRTTINYFARLCYRIRRSITRWNPDVIIATYPLYPFLFERLVYRKKMPERPVHTIITDSISINPVWFKAHSDFYYVTDSMSRSVLIESGVKAEAIFATGFPVSPQFAKEQKQVEEEDACRVLFLTTGHRKQAIDTLKSLENCSYPLKITVVMGRHEKKLRPVLEAMIEEYPHAIELFGWTDRVPEFMCTHDVGIAKAGGATVHEARAACLPLLLNYVVPGQEEGNAELVVRQKCGHVLAYPGEAGHRLDLLLARDRAGLLRLKEELIAVSRPRAAIEIATQVMQTLPKSFVTREEVENGSQL